MKMYLVDELPSLRCSPYLTMCLKPTSRGTLRTEAVITAGYGPLKFRGKDPAAVLRKYADMTDNHSLYCLSEYLEGSCTCQISELKKMRLAISLAFNGQYCFPEDFCHESAL